MSLIATRPWTGPPTSRVRETVPWSGSMKATPDQVRPGRVVDQGHGARERHLSDEGAGGEVVGADLAPGGDPEPVALDLRLIEAVVAARLDDRGDDRHAKLAGRTDAILAEGHDPDRHGVLGQVRVGPLVDRQRRDPVAPVLQELGGGAWVVDLVEVHLVRRIEAPHPD